MKELVNVIKQAQTIALLPHVHADGDALGSCFALAALFRELDKTPCVLLEEKPFSRYDFLNGEAEIYDGTDREFDLVIAVDCSELSRLAERASLFRGNTACIDHHICEHPIGDVSVVDPTAAATAELVFLLTKEFGIMNPKIVSSLYVGISTDCGSFRYSNTTPRTMRIAAELMATGLDTAKINRLLYEQVSLNKLRFDAHCIEKMRMFLQDRVAVTYLTAEQSETLGLTNDDIEGGGNLMLSVIGVGVGAFFHERTPGVFKVSLRSDEMLNVAEIAAQYGGGGHVRASGYTTQLPLEEAINDLIAKISEAL